MRLVDHGPESPLFYRPIAVAAAVLALQGCAQITPAPVVEVDTFNEGIAKTCSYSPMQPKPGATVEATVTMTNDGWCAYRATEAQGKSYLLGLVRQRPAHGELLVRKWNGETRVEYYPAAGYIGADSYTVALRSSASGTADSLVQIAATVSKGDGSSATPPPPADTGPAASTTTRSRSSARRSAARRN